VWGARHALVDVPVALLGLVAVVALVAGCGGGGYSKSDFISRADAICTNTLRQTRALVPPASTSQPGGPQAAYLAQVVSLVQSEASQLRALKRPAGSAHDRATLTAYFAALDEEVAAYRQLEAAARRGDAQTVASVEATLQASPVSGLAAGYGLRTCGTPGSTAA
jgi:hypothetical protein